MSLVQFIVGINSTICGFWDGGLQVLLSLLCRTLSGWSVGGAAGLPWAGPRRWVGL